MSFILIFRGLLGGTNNQDVPIGFDPLKTIREEAHSPLQGMPSFALVILAFGCLAAAAAVAGLTLGLMSLDSTALDIVMQSSNPQQAAAARAIKPVREQGNLLLLTLLLTNTLAAELLPLVLEALVPGGYFSLVVSVLSLLLFGEMIPQAVFSRHPLYFGQKLLGLVKVLRFVLYPFVAPIAFILDSVLGEELGTIYNRDELKGLIDVHANNKILTRDETTILKAALEFSLKTVDQILTPAKDVFRLHIDTKLDRRTMLRILRLGHSRIPLYDDSPNDIICLLLVKQLILVNPDDAVPIRALITSRPSTHKIRVAPAVECSGNTHIPELLNEFQTGRTHMAVVYDDVRKPLEQREFLGIVSIEDIIEEILQEEIVDETDIFIDNVSRMPVLVRNTEGQLVRAKTLASTTTQSLNQRPSLAGTLRIKEIDVRAIRAPLGNFDSTADRKVDVTVTVSKGKRNTRQPSVSSPDLQDILSSPGIGGTYSSTGSADRVVLLRSKAEYVLSDSSGDNISKYRKIKPTAVSKATPTAARYKAPLNGEEDSMLSEDAVEKARRDELTSSPKARDKVKVRPLPMDTSSERTALPERLRRKFPKRVEFGDAPSLDSSPIPPTYGSIGNDNSPNHSSKSNLDKEDELSEV